MSRFAFRPDSCRTANDVRAAVRRVGQLRSAAYGQPQAVPAVRPRPLVEPAPPPQQPSPPAVMLPPEAMPLFPEQQPQPKAKIVNLNCPAGLHQIVARTAAFFGLSLVQFKSERRSAEVARPRQIAMYVAREATKASFPRIGTAMGDRDHSTVLHGVRKVEELLSYGRRDVATAIQAIMAEIGIEWEAPAKTREPPVRPRNLLKPWTDDDIATLTRIYQEEGDRAPLVAAQALGRSEHAVATKAYRLGITEQRPGPRPSRGRPEPT